MPQVPRTTQPQIQETPLPAPQVSGQAPIEAFGGGAPLAQVTRQAQALTGDVQQIIQQEQRRADDDGLNQERRLYYTEHEKPNIYDDKTGLSSRRGRDAIGLDDDIEKRRVEYTRKRLEGIGSPNLRRRVQALFDARKQHNSVKVENWMVQQRETVRIGELEAAIAVAKERSMDDPTTVPLEIGAMNKAIEDRELERGTAPEKIELRKLEEESELHAKVIGRMLSNDQDMLAQGYFEANRERMIGADRDAVRKDLERDVPEIEAQRITDALVGLLPDNEQAAFEQAARIKKQDIRKLVEGKLGPRYARINKFNRQRNSNNFQEASLVIEQTLDLPDKDVMNSFELKDRNSLRRLHEKLNDRGPIRNDDALYYALRIQANSADPKVQQKFRETDLLQFRDKLEKSLWLQLVDRQAHLIGTKFNAKSDELAGGVRTRDRIVGDAFATSGLDTFGLSRSERKKAEILEAEFRRDVDKAVIAKQKKTGDILSDEQIQEEADKLLLVIPTRSERRLGFQFSSSFPFIFGESRVLVEKRAFELELEDIPVDEREVIVDELTRQKIASAQSEGRSLDAVTVSADEVLNLFIEKTQRREGLSGER